MAIGPSGLDVPLVVHDEILIKRPIIAPHVHFSTRRN